MGVVQPTIFSSAGAGAQQADISLRDAQHSFYEFCKVRGWNGANGAELTMLLAEEVGEIAKEVRYLHFNKAEDRQRTVENLGDELVDAFNYLCRIASQYDIDLTQAYARKSDKIARKYPV